MSAEPQTDTQDEPKLTPEACERINLEAIASRERIELAAIAANRDSIGETRRNVALNCALASYGLGHQALNPQPTKIPGDDIIRRAASFDAFLRDGTKPEGDIHVIKPTTPAA